MLKRYFELLSTEPFIIKKLTQIVLIKMAICKYVVTKCKL